MSDTRHLGVAIGLPDRLADHLQSWRRRLGDPNASAIPPHVTLVPPTEVPATALDEVDEHLQEAARLCGPFRLRLRGTGSFRPISPVVFVALVEGISGCELLERAVRRRPLARPVDFPYHPHVTIAHDLGDHQLDEAESALAVFEAAYQVESFALWERAGDGVWRAERDYPLVGPPLGSHPSATVSAWAR